jgi:hypothetical protein
VRELAARRGYGLRDCYAYSDSVTDLPMLETVGHPRAVNPDRALRKVARERQWPILAFGATSPAAPTTGRPPCPRAPRSADARPAHRRPDPLTPAPPTGAPIR